VLVILTVSLTIASGWAPPTTIWGASSLQEWGSGDWIEQNVTIPHIYFWAFVPFLVISAIGLKWRNLSPQELTVIYTMVLIPSLMATGMWSPFGSELMLQLGTLKTWQWQEAIDWVMKDYSDLWFPKDLGVYDEMFRGGATVPWGAWGTPIFFWIMYFFFQCMFFIFAAALLRRLFVDTMRLRFPLAVGARELVESTAAYEKPPLVKKK